MSARNVIFGLAVLCLAAAASGSAQAADCGDPWLTQITTEVLHRPPPSSDAPECNIYLYYGHNSAGQLEAGQWSGYSDLRTAFGTYWGLNSYPSNAAPLQLSIQRAALNTLPPGFSNLPKGTVTVYLYQGNWVSLISQDGSTLTPHIVAAGGGNLVAAGGGNLVAAGGGNLVAAGGGNIQLDDANTALYRQQTGQ
jgi:hypothetical protein